MFEGQQTQGLRLSLALMFEDFFLVFSEVQNTSYFVARSFFSQLPVLQCTLSYQRKSSVEPTTHMPPASSPKSPLTARAVRERLARFRAAFADVAEILEEVAARLEHDEASPQERPTPPLCGPTHATTTSVEPSRAGSISKTTISLPLASCRDSSVRSDSETAAAQIHATLCHGDALSALWEKARHNPPVKPSAPSEQAATTNASETSARAAIVAGHDPLLLQARNELLFFRSPASVKPSPPATTPATTKTAAPQMTTMTVLLPTTKTAAEFTAAAPTAESPSPRSPPTPHPSHPQDPPNDAVARTTAAASSPDIADVLHALEHPPQTAPGTSQSRSLSRRVRSVSLGGRVCEVVEDPGGDSGESFGNRSQHEWKTENPGFVVWRDRSAAPMQRTPSAASVESAVSVPFGDSARANQGQRALLPTQRPWWEGIAVDEEPRRRTAGEAASVSGDEFVATPVTAPLDDVPRWRPPPPAASAATFVSRRFNSFQPTTTLVDQARSRFGGHDVATLSDDEKHSVIVARSATTSAAADAVQVQRRLAAAECSRLLLEGVWERRLDPITGKPTFHHTLTHREVPDLEAEVARRFGPGFSIADATATADRASSRYTRS